MRLNGIFFFGVGRGFLGFIIALEFEWATATLGMNLKPCLVCDY